MSKAPNAKKDSSKFFKTNLPENMDQRREKNLFQLWRAFLFSLFLEPVFKFRKVTGIYNLKEYQSLHSVKKMDIQAGFVVS